MRAWNNLSDNLREQVEILPGVSSTSTFSSFSTVTSSWSSSRSAPHRLSLSRQGILDASNNVGMNSASHAVHSDIAGTALTHNMPYVPPSSPAPSPFTGTSSSASTPPDPILEHFASLTRSALPSTSPTGFTSNFTASSPSVASVSDHTDFDSGQSLAQGADGALGTPATSDTSTEADDIFAFDQNDGGQAASIQEREAFLVGLSLPEEHWRSPLFNNFDEKDGPNLPFNIWNELLDHTHTRFQAREHARPWGPGAEDFELPTCDNNLHAPDPGPAYNKYHSPSNRHSWKNTMLRRKRKGSMISSEPKRRCVKSSGDLQVIGTSQSHQNIVLSIPRCSEEWIDVQGRGSGEGHNSGVAWTRDAFQPTIYRLLNGISSYVGEYVSKFHPSFLVSQLSQTSVLALATEIHGPNGMVRSCDYPVEISFDFGPPVPLEVCTFATDNYELLRSYQKHQGQDTLDVKRSFPIALDLFSTEIVAHLFDTWLDGIINSRSNLLGFKALMLRRHTGANPGDNSVQILNPILSLFLENPRLAGPVFRTALKLLMTTTLLNIVPRITKLDPSLREYLCSQTYPHTSASLDAVPPRLLNRQMKAGVHQLQKEYLSTLFDHFLYSAELDPKVEAAVSLLVAFDLELVGNAGRQYARYSAIINPDAPVDEKDVTGYESDFQKPVFDIVKARIIGTSCLGQLGEKLRVLNSLRKGKGRETQELNFVNEILDILV